MMRPILFLCLFFSLTSYAQNFELVHQDRPIVFPVELELLDSGEILVAGKSGGYSGQSQVLYQISAAGNFVDQQLLPDGFFGSSVTDVEQFESDSRYVVIPANSCSFFPSITVTNLIKAKLDGTLEWSREYLGYSTIILKQYGGDYLAASSYGKIELLDLNGNLLNEKELSFEAVNLLVTDDLKIIIVGYGKYAIWNDPMGNGALTESQSPFQINAVEQLANGNLVFLHRNGIQIVNENFEELNSFSFSETQNNDLLETAENHIYLFVNNELGASIIKFDSELNILSEQLLGSTNIFAQDFKIQNDRVVFLAWHKDRGTSVWSGAINGEYYNVAAPFNGGFWLKSCSLSEIEISARPDIGVSILDVGAVNASSNRCNMYYKYSTEWCNFNEVSIVVHNYGTEPVYSFILNAAYPICKDQDDCYLASHHFEEIENITLLPGEDYQLDFETIALNSVQLNDDYTYDLCFWSSSPNKKADNDYSNNTACFTSAPFVVGVDEMHFPGTINLAPNPAVDLLTVEFPTELEHTKMQFEIYSVDGRLQEVELSKRNQLNVSLLEEGTYILAIKGDGIFVAIRRFLKLGN